MNEKVCVELVLVRHGTIRSNELRLYAGRRTDEPLSAAGRAQCVASGTDESVSRVYASPQLRARETAALCFPCAEVIVVEGLEEMDFGEFEGRSADQMEHDAAYRAWVDSGCMDACPGGESYAEFERRTVAALTELVCRCAERGEERVVVVAHGGTLMCAMGALGENDRSVFEWHVGNCEGYVVMATLDWHAGVLHLSHPRRFAHVSDLRSP